VSAQQQTAVAGIQQNEINNIKGLLLHKYTQQIFYHIQLNFAPQKSVMGKILIGNSIFILKIEKNTIFFSFFKIHYKTISFQYLQNIFYK
jgi:hypothetical protein